MKSGFFLFITTGDVGITEQHQVIDIISRFEKQTPYCTIRHGVFDQIDRPHMQIHHLLDILHLLV